MKCESCDNECVPELIVCWECIFRLSGKGSEEV